VSADPAFDAPFVYLVRFWIHPESHDRVMRWLELGHMAEVVAQPGFRWVRRLRLAQDADDGWTAHMMIYGLDSQQALEAYFTGPLPARFAAERAPFEHHLRMDRAWGAVDFKVPDIP
jgi:hypothetical protein